MVRWQIALFMALIFVGPARADQVDDLVVQEMSRQHIPGLSLAVVKDGKIIKEKGYGLANIEDQEKVTSDTVFNSGSIGKQFTAALVMLLVDDGKIKLDNPISVYLSNAPEAWRKTTVRNLLTHTSGLPRFGKSLDLQREYSEDELLQNIFDMPLRVEPGEEWHYSNLGYIVLGAICSKVGGKFYGTQLNERIFSPIGMHTKIVSERNIVPHRAAGYDRVEGKFYNAKWASPTFNATGDGSLYLTAHDLALWSIALDDDKILSKADKDVMWTPVRLNDGSTFDYGFGWFLGSVNGHRYVGHDGSWQGFTTQITRFLDDKFAVIVLVNRSRASPDRIANKIAAQFLPGLVSAKKGPLSANTFASRPFFLRGSMNKWSANDQMKRVGRSDYEVTIALEAGTYQFKIGTEDWGAIDLGAPFDDPPMAVDQAEPMEFQGENLVLEVTQPGHYIFQFDATKPLHPLLTVRLTAQN